MRLTIKTNESRFFRQALEILSSMPPIDKLRNRELDLLATLMYYNYKYKDIDEVIRWRVINDTATRKDMQAELSMNEDIFNNNMSLIRKAGLIDSDNKIARFLQLIPSDNAFEITFNFNIEKNGNE